MAADYSEYDRFIEEHSLFVADVLKIAKFAKVMLEFEGKVSFFEYCFHSFTTW